MVINLVGLVLIISSKIKAEILLVVFGRLLLSFSGVLLIVVLLSVLDAREYSRYVLLFSTASWLSAVVFAAINIPLLNLLVSEIAIPSANRKMDVRSLTFSLTVYTFPVSLIFSTVLSYVVFKFISDGEINSNFFICFATGILSSCLGCVGMISTHLMAERKRIQNIFVTSGFLLIRVCLILLVITFFTYSVATVFGAVVLAGVLGLISALLIAFDQFELLKLSSTVVKLKEKNFQRSYLENWPIAVGNNIFLFGDKVFLALVLPIEAIGLLSIYQQFSRMIANLTSGSAYQFIAPILLGTSKGDSPYYFFLTSLCSFAIYLVFVLPCYFIFEIVSETLLDSKFFVSGLDYILVAVTVGLNSGSRIIELRFFKDSKIGSLHLPMCSAIVTFIVLGYYLGSNLGLTGAALALLSAALVRLIGIVVSATIFER